MECKEIFIYCLKFLSFYPEDSLDIQTEWYQVFKIFSALKSYDLNVEDSDCFATKSNSRPSSIIPSKTSQVSSYDENLFTT
ncbi:hypothetical protein C0J52_28220 [Blattella germanica]|nr:hypothetical protein C0J52_28220 [Blattella germanica]